MTYNAADPKQIRAAEKRAKADREARHSIILSVMVTPAGRHYIYDRLVACHIFHSSYSNEALAMAFAEGERNVGLQLLGDVMAAAPDQYIQMMREASDREKANDGSSNTSTSNGSGRRAEDDGRSDSRRSDDADGSADTDYNPADRIDD